jgi:hypothetical protein
MRSRYWSCSKFADWVRGTPSLKVGSSSEWNEWTKTSKAKHPIRYWIAEELLSYIQNAVNYVPDKLHDVKYYINNRWVTRTHALTAHPRDIAPGDWRDVGSRFIPCLFNELQDFVEIELAWSHIAWDDEARAKFKAPWWSSGWWRWRTWRCPEAGLENLEWRRNYRWSAEEVGADSELVGELTPHAYAYQEIYELYKWWTEVYRNRPDPHNASGWTDFCARRRALQESESAIAFLDFENDSEETRAESKRILDLCNKIEQEYEDEDTEMLTKLIRVRQHLWT